MTWIQRVATVLFAVTALTIGVSQRGHSSEPMEKFLDGLLDRGYFDVALDYLQSLRGNNRITAEQKAVIPYKEGETLVAQSKLERNHKARMALLDRAQERYQEFISANSEHSLIAQCQMQLGVVLMERGRALIQQSAMPQQANNKDALIAEGRGRLAEAGKVFDDAVKRLTEEYATFPKLIDPKKEPDKAAQRKEVRNTLLRAKILVGDMGFELARSYPVGAPERNEQLKAAAERYGKSYEDDRKKIAGMIARAKQGHCFQEMGDCKQALSYYDAVLAIPPEQPPARELISSTMAHAIECWITDDEKKYEVAITRGEEWLKQARGAEDRHRLWLGVRLATAKAMLKFSEKLPADQAAQKKPLQQAARQHLILVSRRASEHQDEAKQLLRTLSGQAEEGSDEGAPTTFAKAKERAQGQLDTYSIKSGELKAAEQEKRPADAITALTKEVETSRQQAIDDLQLAISLRDEQTPLDEVNNVRSTLSYLYHEQGDYFHAIVLGEFVVHFYPDSAGARNAAKVVLSSYNRLYMSNSGNKDFERAGLYQMADFMAKKWPGEPEADDAWNTLTWIAVQERQPDEAIKCLERIGANSPRRGESELRVGQLIWADFLEKSRLDDAARPSPEVLSALMQKADGLLLAGLDRLRPSVDDGSRPVDRTIANAALARAQITNSASKPGDAITILNDPKIGPLTLVLADDPIVKQGAFAVETYKLCLRAYVGTQQLDKAEETMAKLEQLVASSGDEKGATLLTQIYISLGRELGQQLARLRAANNLAELESVSKGFELFLRKIAERPGNTFNSLNWVADTFYNMAQGADSGGDRIDEQAKNYYSESLKANQRVLDAAASDPAFAPDGSLISVRIRMSKCQRRLGQYEQALKLLEQILLEKPTLLDAQKEAAYTYQEWGRKDATQYRQAIGGALKQPGEKRAENLIWGWAKMGDRLGRNEKFKAAFHEARYNEAWCRWQWSITQQGESKTKGLAAAEQTIIITSRLDRDMGGAESQKKYDTLLRNIQKTAGKTATGLPMQTPMPTGGGP